MIVITVSRKPLDGTVAKNILKHGTGGINVDATRIFCGSEHMRTVGYAHKTPIIDGDRSGLDLRNEFQHTNAPGGRWPANFILSHLPGCVQQGTSKVKGSAPTPSGLDRINANMQMQGARPGAYQKGTPEAPADRRNPDGTETVTVWECVDGCPVRGLDGQSGTLTSGKLRAEVQRGSFGNNGIYGLSDGTGLGKDYPADKGGASRFFKTIKGD